MHRSPITLGEYEALCARTDVTPNYHPRFVAYYFALPILVGYWPEAMRRPVVGRINVAYLFALSQFVMAWALMAAYVRRARAYDRLADAVRRQAGAGS